MLAHEAWWLGSDSDKDSPGQTPPARAPASTQIIVLRARVRSTLSNRRSAELVSSPRQIAPSLPNHHASNRDVIKFFR